MGHPGPGETVTGTWTARICDQVSIDYGYNCDAR
jgi:hypothetical protein